MGQKGQGTTEYLLLVAAVVAVIVVLTSGKNSMFQSKMTNTVNMTMSGLENEAKRLVNVIGNNN